MGVEMRLANGIINLIRFDKFAKIGFRFHLGPIGMLFKHRSLILIYTTSIEQ